MKVHTDAKIPFVLTGIVGYSDNTTKSLADSGIKPAISVAIETGTDAGTPSLNPDGITGFVLPGADGAAGHLQASIEIAGTNYVWPVSESFTWSVDVPPPPTVTGTGQGINLGDAVPV